MAFKLISRDWCPCVGGYRCGFVMDAPEDAADLPKCCVGSTAMVADKDGAMFIVNASGEWKEV